MRAPVAVAAVIPGPDPRPANDQRWWSHRRDAAIEDVEWLMARGCTLEAALERVGVPPSTYDQWLRRGAA